MLLACYVCLTSEAQYLYSCAFCLGENSLLNCLYPVLFQYFEIAMISRQLDCGLKNTHSYCSKLKDGLLVLLSNDRIA